MCLEKRGRGMGWWELLATAALCTPQTLTSLLSIQIEALGPGSTVSERGAGVLGAPSATQGLKH